VIELSSDPVFLGPFLTIVSISKSDIDSHSTV